MIPNIETLIQMLHSVTEYDIIDFGCDSDGNKCFAIRNLSNQPSMLSLGNLEIDDFPQWNGKDNN